jgi:superfamily II DNA or RNA helicase
MSYQEFIASKNEQFAGVGFDPFPVSCMAFPFQADIVGWATRKGRAAIFADCGLGKTFMQLEWARQVAHHCGLPVLIVAPLSVAQQTVREASKFGIDAEYSRSGDFSAQIVTCNYEMLHHFDPSLFGGVVIDESSILKAFDGKTRNEIIESFRETPFRLACTATPSPNDFMELGNHAEFLGIMTMAEMLSKFFFHDGGDTQTWTLKGHAEDEFWKWVCSWAVMIRKPSDIGHSDEGFDLPDLQTIQHTIATPADGSATGTLFQLQAVTLEEQRAARKATLSDRCHKVADLCSSSDEQWIVWCDLNAEGDMLEKIIDGAEQVSGADTTEQKEDKLARFSDGSLRVLITKTKIAGFGLNWQHCHNVAFVGVTHSFEAYYQAIRRCWRFGQKQVVKCHVVSSDIEGNVVSSLGRKESDAKKMAAEMLVHMGIHQNTGRTERMRDTYAEKIVTGNGWEMRLGDCVEHVKTLESESVGFSVFSPPFASLYTYSNSPRDMGNCRTHSEFYQHFRFLVDELLRVTIPGRLVSFHCMNLPTSKARDGYIGISDFRGDLIRIFQDAGWIFHSEVVIWKDPVTAMQRTKALGLLHKTLVKDSSMSRQGIPDYLVTMRKPGVNPIPVKGPLSDYVGTNPPNPESPARWNRDEMRQSIDIWQRYASPVWMDINPSRTLQKESAREEKDERHICPLQLDVIERAMQLWSIPGDLVLSPFGGIGSEGYVAIQAGRRFIGFELKESYFRQACLNLQAAQEMTVGDLFTVAP